MRDFAVLSVMRKWLISRLDIAAALTNIDILNRPLQETDADFNRGVHALVLVNQQNRIVARQRANQRYHERRRERLGILEENSFEDL